MLITATVQETLPATPRSALLRVSPETPLPFAAGQAVEIGEHGRGLRRPYSIALGPRSAARTGQLEFLVGLGPEGTPGPHLPALRPGLVLDIEGPFGAFTFPPNPSESHVLFVAGGSGIAPLRAMLHEALELGPRMRLSLLYSARTPEDFAFAGELQELHRSGRVHVLRTVTRTAGPAWDGARGRISRAELEAVVETPDTLCFVCGPEALVHEVPRMLREIGIADSRIRVEEWVRQ